MAVQVWTSGAGSFESTPLGSDSASNGDDRIRELKETTGALLNKEHAARDQANVGAQGWHREGSAIAYHAATAPTNRPDGATALDTTDAGRLWIDSDDGTLDYWDGSAFADVKLPEVDLIREHLDKSDDYTILDDDANTIFVTTADTNRTITLPTAADNAGRNITVKKVDSGTGTVIIDGEGAETIDGATTVVLNAQYGLWRGMCDGTTWHTGAATGSAISTGDVTLKVKVLDIGDWNMDSTISVNLSIGSLDITKIRSVSVVVRNDAGNVYADLTRGVSASSSTQQGYYFISSGVGLVRLTGGYFDNSTFDSTGYNRGWVTIWYEA